MTTTTLFLSDDGTIATQDTTVHVPGMEAPTVKRASRILPRNLVLRMAFLGIRTWGGGQWASWARRWDCDWMAFIGDGTTLGPFRSRDEAITREIDYIASLGQSGQLEAIKAMDYRTESGGQR